MPSRAPPRTQLSLDLDRRPPAAPMMLPEEAVHVLADLPLAAVGRDLGAPRTGGGDEREDHR